MSKLPIHLHIHHPIKENSFNNFPSYFVSIYYLFNLLKKLTKFEQRTMGFLLLNITSS